MFKHVQTTFAGPLQMEHLITVSSSVSWWRWRRRQGTIARTMLQLSHLRQLHCHRPQCSNWESASGTPEQDQKIKFQIESWGVSPFLPVWKLGSKLPQFPFHREWSPFHRGYAMTMAHSFQHGCQALGKPFVQRQFIVSAIRFLGRSDQGHYRETKRVKVEGPLGGLVDVRCCCCCCCCCCCSNFWVKVQIRIPFDG